MPAQAEASGWALIGLAIRDETAGLGNRTLLTLGKRNETQALPWHRFSTGSPVLLSEEGMSAPHGVRGVVVARTRETVEIACAQRPEAERDRATWRLDLSSDEVSRGRQISALARRDADRGRLAQLREVLLGQRGTSF